MKASATLHLEDDDTFEVIRSGGIQWLMVGGNRRGSAIDGTDEQLSKLRDALDDHFADRNGVTLPCPVVMAGARAE